MTDIKEVYKKSYDHIFGNITIEDDIDKLKREWLDIFCAENKLAVDWARQIGVHHNTFRDFFTKDTRAPRTVKKFSDALIKIKNNSRIEEK